MSFIATPAYVTASSTNSDDPLTVTGKPLRWGVVSTGNIAHKVTADLALLPDAELYAVSSRQAENAEAFAQKFGFTRWYADTSESSGYQALINDPDVDVVYIGTPHGQHYEIARAALQAQKHVLCEKSLTINAHQAAELIELAKERKVFLMEAVWARFVPGMRRVFEVVNSGELGDLQWVQADLGFPAPTDPTSRIWAPQDGGGALLDLTVYPLQWAWAAFGLPDTVHAVAKLNAEGVDEQNALTFAYDNGSFAQLTSSLVALCPRRGLISGRQGSIESIPSPTTGEHSLNNPKALKIRHGFHEEVIEEITVVGHGYTYELREVQYCIQQGLTQSPAMPWADSLATMELFDAVRAQLGITYPQDANYPNANYSAS